MSETKESFILYNEHYELFKRLTKEQAGELICAIFDYNQNGKTENLEGIVDMAFISIRQDLDRNALKYEQKREKLRENGKKGGRPRKDDYAKTEMQTVNKENSDTQKNENEKNFAKNQMVFSESKKSLYENANVNVNEDAYVNVNEYVNEYVNDSFFSLDKEREKKEFEKKEREKNEILSAETETETEIEKEKNTEKEIETEKENLEILEKYIRKNRLATKSVRAYAQKMIANGDHIPIILAEKRKLEMRKNQDTDNRNYTAYDSKPTHIKAMDGVPPPPHCTLEAVMKRCSDKQREKMNQEMENQK